MINVLKDRSLPPILIFVAVIFLVSYLWRRYRDDDIKTHSKYTVGRITKHLGSLKNGTQWYFEFKYQNNLYEGYRSSHIDYNVNLGDLFLVNFSSSDPTHNKLLYEYKFNDSQQISDKVWDTIPIDLVHISRKKE